VDYEEAIENTAEPVLKASLMASQYAVEAVISADNKARIEQTTVAFAALLKQINTTNKGLDELQKQIRKVASDISMYGAILGGIAKVLTLVPIA
jgi:septal ring factor EnvC (AmiA/AmiB activator)